jgi:F-type H+-transporting ATPase subunit b
MLIDWFTLGAQLANFLILVALLRRFLYRPILQAIAEREQSIAASLEAAAQREAEAERLRQEYQAERSAFAEACLSLRKGAESEAHAERERLLEEAHREAEELALRQRERLRQEAEHIGEALSQGLSQEALSVARQALKELAGQELEERMAEVFLLQLAQLHGPEGDALQGALGEGPALLRSSLERPPSLRLRLEQGIRGLFPQCADLRFACDPGLVRGIELSAQGLKFAWSIDSYLRDLELRVQEILRDGRREGL